MLPCKDKNHYVFFMWVFLVELIILSNNNVVDISMCPVHCWPWYI